MTDISLIETDLVPILASHHGRQRRQERKIAMKDLHAAIKYGKKELSPMYGPNGERRWMYTFAGITFVTDFHSRDEITSWVPPGYGVEVSKVEITTEMKREHEDALFRLQDKSLWTSHTVVVVDQSGPMRETDTTECITRSDMVESCTQMCSRYAQEWTENWH